ncbi:MAG: heme-dependent peroxidase [Acidobacteria bacterium]|nr:heme-dependent peroxidase [Acidobacteriota bacterium]
MSAVETSMPVPQVPETLEGWSLLHQMFRIRWHGVRNLSAAARNDVAQEASSLLESMNAGENGSTATVNMLGHKADLMLIHFRRTFEDLSRAELAIAGTRLHDHLEVATSYVSVVELGMYEMTAKLYQQPTLRALDRDSPEFRRIIGEEMTRQRDRVISRLYPEVPRHRHVCFYPMNKRRGERKNWYAAPFEARAAMMREHGVIGRLYSGQVVQIISGSIGYDDWEWGVDLFADDALVFKKLIYEMRFDQASAEYAEFGPFYVGLQFAPHALDRLLAGEPPAL